MAPAQASFLPCTQWSQVSAHAAAQCPAEAKHHGNAGTSLPGPHSWDLAGLPGCSGVAVDKISCIPQGHLEMLSRNQRVALFPVFQGLGVVVGLRLSSPVPRSPLLGRFESRGHWPGAGNVFKFLMGSRGCS